MASDRLTRSPERRDLSEFVRSCRERASHEAAGLPQSRRRRTKGLRREEVAALSGVGLTWYTWFEQGRDIAVSDDFLHRLARGLRLDRAEQEHLFALAGRISPSTETKDAQLPEALVRMIRASPQAAYIMNRSWDVLVYNDAAADLFADLRKPRPNMLRIVLLSEHYRHHVKDWHSAARLVMIKARHDYLTVGKSPRLRSLLNDITESVPEAKDWWNDPAVIRIGDTVVTLRDAQGNWLDHRVVILTPEDNPGVRVVFYDVG
jgi:transcriptional regulator with XRE-family HTH domain